MTDRLPHDCGNSLEWFALYVRTKYERTVSARIRDKGYETYVPVWEEHRKWADNRVITAQIPLFPNYVFCRLDPRYRMPVIGTPAVYGIVGVGITPTAIPAEQIEAVQRMIEFAPQVESASAINAGERVIVMSGPLSGIMGTVVRVKNAWRLTVLITLLQRGVTAEFDLDCVRRVDDTDEQTARLPNYRLLLKSCGTAGKA